MAAVVQIIDSCDISKGWLQTDNISGSTGAFIIGIKGSASKNDTFDIKDLSYIVLEIGIPSGLDAKPLSYQRVKLNFKDITSFDDIELNNKTAYAKIGPMPSTIYIKPVTFADQMKEYTTGKMPISINVLPY